jgi:glutamate/aspartate transport system substrate-binding protein
LGKPTTSQFKALRDVCAVGSIVLLMSLLAVERSALAAATEPPAVTRETDDLALLRQRGELRIGYQDSAFPFAYLAGEADRHVGFSVDLCSRIVAQLQTVLGRPASSRPSPALTLRAVSVTSKTRIPLLLNGTIDLECGSTTATKARLALGHDDDVGVAFSQMIFWSDVAAAVADTAEMQPYRRVSQLPELSLVAPVVTTSGSTSVKHLAALERAQRRPIRRVYAARHSESFAWLERGDASAFVMDRVLLRSQLDAQRFRLLEGQIAADAGESYGLMLRKSDRGLRTVVDQVLHELKRNGEFERLYARWFLQPLPAPRAAKPQARRAALHPAIGLPMSDQLRQSLQAPAPEAIPPGQ